MTPAREHDEVTDEVTDLFSEAETFLTLTMISSTNTEPLRGWLGLVFVSKVTEQGLKTYERTSKI